MIPDLNESEYEVLKASIREAGRILVPVVVASDGEVIDGKGRVRAADELKIKEYPREIVHGLDAEARLMRRLSLELRPPAPLSGTEAGDRCGPHCGPRRT